MAENKVEEYYLTDDPLTLHNILQHDLHVKKWQVLSKMLINHPYPYYHIDQISNLINMVVNKALNDPDGIAFSWYLKDTQVSISYLHFYEDIIYAAKQIEHKKQVNCHIGLIGNNSYEWLLIYMAILLSGNVAVVLDKDMESGELENIVQRMDIVAIIADESIKAKMSFDSPVDIFLFSEITEHRDIEQIDIDLFSVNTEIDPDKLACIFLTSGTTGARKGVMLSHRNIASNINESCKLFKLDGDTLAVLPFHHAFGLIVAVWMVFNYGHTVYISQGLRRINKELMLVKPQTLMLVPLFVENFSKQIRMTIKKNRQEIRFRRTVKISNALLRCGIDIRRMIFKDILSQFGGKIEYIICGGAFLDKEYVKEFRSYGIEILNGYGTTECSPVAAVNRNKHHKDGSVGLSLPNSKVSVSSDGEVLVSGEFVMQGYYKDPDSTSQSIINGWYHTGDLGRIDKEGFVFLSGRKTNLIVLSNGENISPEEIEQMILRIENVDEVVVSSDNGRINASIYSKDLDAIKKREIKEQIDELNRTMPMYKRVSQIVFRDEEFKKTTTKKIVRND
ncbi:MAG: AMP-binding protein [Lachnospiraceae bacterium]|nr:AMP-binding protein [Lachnospiraceae bacterium]MBQ6364437.1 AMP-binding protein [Lachnospiraceae bacterium]